MTRTHLKLAGKLAENGIQLFLCAPSGNQPLFNGLLSMHGITKQRMLVPSNSGFTLLELLVVLLLFSLIASLALPRISTLQSSFQSAADRDEILLQLAELGYQVMQRGYGGQMLAPDSAKARRSTDQQLDFSSLPLSLPAGWELIPQQDILYLSNGICLGGEIRALSASNSFTVRLHPPYCQPEMAGSGPL